jgi:fumarate reductase (CoM/CoB) subunit B
VSQCCSSPLFRGGLINEAKKAAEQLRKEIEKNKVRTLISSCPGCTLTFREVYPSFFKDWRIKSLHISELLIKKGKKMKKAGVKESPSKIIYHDPCHLARGLDIVSEPREILKSQGYEVLEFYKGGKESLCCGAGGGVALLWPNEAKTVGKRKIQEALDSGADVLATFCPLCEHTLDRAAKGRIEIKDIIELL